MKLETAKAIADMEHHSHMVYRKSKPWHHRGIKTDFSHPEDLAATDWQVVGQPDTEGRRFFYSDGDDLMDVWGRIVYMFRSGLDISIGGDTDAD